MYFEILNICIYVCIVDILLIFLQIEEIGEMIEVNEPEFIRKNHHLEKFLKH